MNMTEAQPATEPESEVVEALKLILVIVEDEAYKVEVGQSRCKHVDALNEVHEVATAALGHTDGTWDAAIEAAAKVAESTSQAWRSMKNRWAGDPDHETHVDHLIEQSDMVISAIRNLSPRAASSGGEGA